jgi:steroid delta-isomerase-like uncharacterized protein
MDAVDRLPLAIFFIFKKTFLMNFKPPIFLLTSIITLIIISCNGNKPMMSNENDAAVKNKATAMALNDAFFRGDSVAMDSMLAPDFVEHQVIPGITGSGRHLLDQMIASYHAAFPDPKFTVISMTAEGDYVNDYGTLTATNTGSFMGMPATNKAIKVDGSDCFRFSNGKLAEHWGLSDDAAMMQQLGIGMPADTSKKKM